MTTTLIAIGDELVGGFTLDTNSHWLAERLRALGFPVKRITQIRDQEAEIVEQVRRDLGDPEVTNIFCSGGLGPTPDDRTWSAVATSLGRGLTTWEPTRARIEARVREMHAAGRYGIDSPIPTEATLRMARIAEGPTRVFSNHAGMAPAAVYEVDGKRLFVLPGVPRELKSIFAEDVEPEYLQGGRAATVRELRFRSAPESSFYSIMRELEASHVGVSVGSYPSVETRLLTIRCSGQDPSLVESAREAIRQHATRLGFEIVDSE